MAKGCCGTFISIILSIVNIVFLLLGIGLVVTVCVLRWGNVAKINEIDGIQSYINLVSINVVVIVLICIGAFAIFLSFLGLAGICCSNRIFLVIHEIVVVILFLLHLAALIFVLATSSTVENELNKGIIKIVEDLNKTTANTNEYDRNTKLLYSISDVFSCCGARGRSDFRDTVTLEKSCKPANYNTGCIPTVYTKLKDISIYLLVIPSSVILFVELISIICVPFLIGQISRKRKSGAY